jgi:putative oxidoreductase|tara:strand:+ start:3419 stop:3841 length:423 start_codon:yes stop_codon:yes gene_type:complete
MITALQTYIGVAGRVLIGVYFLIPGITKVTNFQGTADYMRDHGMIFVPFFLVLTIIVQLAGAAMLITGYRVAATAFILAGLTLVISLAMHDFWNVEAGIQQAHETQNFVKNLAIMAGLMALAGGQRTLAISIDKAKNAAD